MAQHYDKNRFTIRRTTKFGFLRRKIREEIYDSVEHKWINFKDVPMMVTPFHYEKVEKVSHACPSSMYDMCGND